MYQSGTKEHEMSYSVPDCSEFPPLFVKSRKDKELKDVVRESLLPFLPAKTLAQFTTVSKEWNQWIKSPLLAYQQSNHFKELSGFFLQNELQHPRFLSLNASIYGVPVPTLEFLPERVDILSSCNGLLVCQGRGLKFDEEVHYICNPANKEWTALPKPLLYHGAGLGLVLAFEPSARNIEQRYQIICAVPLLGEIRFELYTSVTESWKVLEKCLVDKEDLSFTGHGFYMNGVAYWQTNTGNVIAFHLEKELYEVIPLPCSSDGVLTQIRGELCYITMSQSHCSGNEYHISIYGGMDLSLKRRLEISIGDLSGAGRFKVLPCFDGEKVMILFENCIYSYSINDEILEEKRHVEVGSVHADKYLVYVNSLVQLPKVVVSSERESKHDERCTLLLTAQSV